MTTVHIASGPPDATPLTRYVTPSLYLGQPYLPDTQKVSTWAEAVAVIESGSVAVLPPEAYEEAERTLSALGVCRSIARSRIHHAKHGTLL